MQPSLSNIDFVMYLYYSKGISYEGRTDGLSMGIKIYSIQRFPKLLKSCSHFDNIAVTDASLRSTNVGCILSSRKNGYLVQTLVAKVDYTVAIG